MAYTYAQISKAIDHCLKQLGETLRKNQGKKDRLEGFLLRPTIRAWAKEDGIREGKDMEAFVEEVREAVEGAVLTYGLTEDLLQRKREAEARVERMHYSEVYTLYEPRRRWASEKLEEDEA